MSDYPSFDQIVSDITNAEKTIVDQANQVTQLQGQVSSQDAQISELQSQVSQIQSLSTGMTLTQKQQRLVDVAKSLIGQVQYVVYTQRQEDVPPFKTDCSGFTYLVYKMSGVLIPFPPTSVFNRSVVDQGSAGSPIGVSDESQWEVGDLIIFSIPADNPPTSTTPTHVGMYIGNGQFIHNQNPTMDVNVANVSEWQNKIVSIRRILTV